MKTVSVIKAAQKAGLKVIAGGNRITIETDSILGGFIDQNGYAVALRTIAKRDLAEHKPEYDERRDSFHYSIKGFLSAFA